MREPAAIAGDGTAYVRSLAARREAAAAVQHAAKKNGAMRAGGVQRYRPHDQGGDWR